MFSRVRLFRCFAAAAILLVASLPLATRAFAGSPLQLHFTNTTNRSFVVSWVSSVAEVGFVKWGRTTSSVTKIARDQRDTATTCKPPSSISTCTKSKIHYVVVSDINGFDLSNPTYFDVVSGATVDTNATMHYRVRPPTLPMPPPAPDVAFGQVLTGGLPITTDALVYYTVLDANGKPGESSGVSEERSVLVLKGEQGYWNVDLASLRTPDLRSQFIYSSGDLLNIYAQTGKTQSAYQSIDVGSGNPKPTMDLVDWTAAKQALPVTGPTGKWTNVLNQPNAVDKSYWRGVKTSNGVATASLHCDNCSLIRWYTIKSAATGITHVTIDGNPYSCVNGILTTCSGYNGSRLWQYVWSFFVTPGPHDLTLTGPSVTTTYFYLDAFEVW